MTCFQAYIHVIDFGAYFKHLFKEKSIIIFFWNHLYYRVHKSTVKLVILVIVKFRPYKDHYTKIKNLQKTLWLVNTLLYSTWSAKKAFQKTGSVKSWELPVEYFAYTVLCFGKATWPPLSDRQNFPAASFPARMWTASWERQKGITILSLSLTHCTQSFSTTKPLSPNKYS